MPAAQNRPLTLLLVDIFDNIGTLIGVTKRAGFLRPDGTLPRAGLTAATTAVLMLAAIFFLQFFHIWPFRSRAKRRSAQAPARRK